MNIQVFDPTGWSSVSASFAPRLESLEGKTVGFLSNGHWQAGRTLPHLRALLAERYPSTSFVSVEGRHGVIDTQPVIDSLVGAGCDAVIVGHAA